MTDIEELQSEIDALRGRLAACESAMATIADGLGSMLEVTGVVTRKQIADLILFEVRSRRLRHDGSDAELDLIETAGRRLLEPSASVASPGVTH